MARISFPTPDTMNAEQRAVYDDIVSGPRARLVGPLRAALHNPKLADRWQKMGALLRFGTSIAPRHSELAILVTARRWNSQLEWYIHAEAAQKAGLPQNIIDAMLVAEAPVFADAGDAAVYEYARQLLQQGVVDEPAYQRVLGLFGEAGTVELTAIVGYYSMVAMTLNAHHIPLPDEGAVAPLHPVAGNSATVLTLLPQAAA
ncbi:carboxymuconolactone decarboxylase family protein [Duganella aceris]|uniref:Carboxymuconolactone decarboxylase family protein n=1 Tax=Duganella aceris TaxID=2703883 RepID=A0ABX0FKU0_9BURK|nr:carboxymuconolactone decarboxylase family protein [Duganella aceris]NGZ85211.1 carboxymuconolactone decarboxylase family protein [Duganella aceris]